MRAASMGGRLLQLERARTAPDRGGTVEQTPRARGASRRGLSRTDGEWLPFAGVRRDGSRVARPADDPSQNIPRNEHPHPPHELGLPDAAADGTQLLFSSSPIRFVPSLLRVERGPRWRVCARWTGDTTCFTRRRSQRQAEAKACENSDHLAIRGMVRRGALFRAGRRAALDAHCGHRGGHERAGSRTAPGAPRPWRCRERTKHETPDGMLGDAVLEWRAVAAGLDCGGGGPLWQAADPCATVVVSWS